MAKVTSLHNLLVPSPRRRSLGAQRGVLAVCAAMRLEVAFSFLKPSLDARQELLLSALQGIEALFLRLFLLPSPALVRAVSGRLAPLERAVQGVDLLLHNSCRFGLCGS